VSAPTNAASAAGGTPGRRARADRPVRFEDPARNAAYWARIDRIVDEAPPLTIEQKATLRGIFAPVVAAMAKEEAA
jgi:hypothetical protein